MIIYQNDVFGFREAVDRNTIVREIEQNFREVYGRGVSAPEKAAWNNSLRFMETALRKAQIPDDGGVLVEYNIPATSKRIDVIVSGHDEEGNANFVIVELKQWSEARSSSKEDLVVTYVGKNYREVAHPSYQAFSYKAFLSDMNQAITDHNLNPFSCAYLHNYPKKDPEPLLAEQYLEIIRDTPVFFQNDTERLNDFLRRYVGKGNGKQILYQIENGRIRPSKKFIEYVTGLFEGNREFTLLDEQKIAYSNILEYAKSGDRKTTIIVDGGPGTGKSVVAMNAFASLLKMEKNIQFVAPNASFRATLVHMLASSKRHKKSRLNHMFSGSSGYVNVLDDEFDVLVVDEAHRLKKKGAYMYRGESQVEDVIRASRVNVFFVDDRQMIRPDDEGSVERIIRGAEKYSSRVVRVHLNAQFRCSGAEGFINWMEHTLQIRDTANFDGWDEEAFEFGIVEDPNILAEIIREKRKEGHKARLLAGFAWPWTGEKDGNPDAEVQDVDIPECHFSMPWNSRRDQYSWPIDDSKAEQIGCVHTSQGMEFDYVGVIIGNDLKYDPSSREVYASYNDYYDRTGRKGLKNDPDGLTRLIKNIYRILLSRGMKGCYIFCRDRNLQEYIRGRIKGTGTVSYSAAITGEGLAAEESVTYQD